jgi:hypothetical protein
MLHRLKLLFGFSLVGVLGGQFVMAAIGASVSLKAVIGALATLGLPWLILSVIDGVSSRNGVRPTRTDGSNTKPPSNPQRSREDIPTRLRGL